MNHERTYTSRQTVQLEIRAFLKVLRSDGAENLKFIGARSETLPIEMTQEQIDEFRTELDGFLAHIRAKLEANRIR
jgi:hypothetical protein